MPSFSDSPSWLTLTFGTRIQENTAQAQDIGNCQMKWTLLTLIYYSKSFMRSFITHDTAKYEKIPWFDVDRENSRSLIQSRKCFISNIRGYLYGCSSVLSLNQFAEPAYSSTVMVHNLISIETAFDSFYPWWFCV